MNDRDMSLRFYNYLCDQIGTEHVVKARRTYFATLDYILRMDEFSNVSSGSKAEGLDLKGSDFDAMILLNRYEVVETEPDDKDVKSNSFVMVTKDTKPGFTQLQVCGAMQETDINKFCVPYGQTFLLSSEKVKNWFLHSAQHFPKTIHGPCISNQNETIDIAICFRCKTWIHQARCWIKRSRVWPSADVVSHIINNGVLFVPIGCNGSPNEDVEWRISFSIPEKQLIFCFNHVQLLCYGLLKILLKEIIDKIVNIKGLLCSYFVKTVVFWVSEEVPVTAWQPANIMSCFMNCFRKLIYCVRYSNLPHYFITDNNLFEDRFNSLNGANLNSVLNELYRKGPLCLMHSESMVNFFLNSQRFPVNVIRTDFDILVGQLHSVIQLPLPKFTNFWSALCADIMKNVYSLCKKRHNSPIFYMLFFSICQHIGKTQHPAVPSIMQFEPLKSVIAGLSVNTDPGEVCVTVPGSNGPKWMKKAPDFCNKNIYRIHKQYLPFIILGLRTDAATGWLYLASYYYCQNQYKLSLKIINYALSKCTPDKIYYIDDILTKDHLHVIESQALQYHYLKIGDLYKRHGLQCLLFRRECFTNAMIPHELETELIFNHVLIHPPVVYAHFLSFVCSFKLHDVDGCLNSLRQLELTVDENFFTGIHVHQSVSYNKLGIAYYMLGDLNTATKCFLQSFNLDAKQEKFVNFMLYKMKYNF